MENRLSFDSLRKHPFLLALRRWGRFARRRGEERRGEEPRRNGCFRRLELRALELGNSRLHRMVQDEDLFVKEAQFHPSCGKSIDLKYANYLHDIACQNLEL